MRFFTIICFFLIITNGVVAQVVREKGTNYEEEEFFADQNKGEARLAIKTDVFTAIIGQIPLLAEVRLNRDVSIEAGVIYVYNELFMPMGENSSLKEYYKIIPTIGGSVEGRYYFQRTFGSVSDFIGLRYKYKKIKREAYEPLPDYDPTIISETYNSIIFMWGRQYTFKDRFLFEYTVGMGYNHAVFLRYNYNSSEGTYSPVEYMPNFFDDGHVPLILQAGLRFGILTF